MLSISLGQKLLENMLKLASLLLLNIDYTITILILIFIETLRVSITKTRNLMLLESLLLAFYLWSIEIVLTYTAISYIFLKILDPYISSYEQHDEYFYEEKQTEIRFRKNGLIMIALGICIATHLFYSYILPISIATICIYLMIFLVTICLDNTSLTIYTPIEILLSVLPPFGVIILLHARKIRMKFHECNRVISKRYKGLIQ